MAGEQKHIKVAVRIRPLQPHEKNHKEVVIVNTEESSVVVQDPKGGSNAARRYQFDAVLPSSTTQDQLFDSLGLHTYVEAVTAGIHSTVLTYGQTGSGKTYTMEGFPYHQASKGGVPSAVFGNVQPEELGIVPRALQELFRSTQGQTKRSFTVRCSFVQVYKEQAYDLLNPSPVMLAGVGSAPGKSPQVESLRLQGMLPSGSGALRMRWSPGKGFHLENLYWVGVESPQEALDVYMRGVGNKVMASHRLNAASSRSHCLFTAEVSGWPVECPAEVVTAHLTLVDLAGSERPTETGSVSGALKDESVFINKSLMSLRKVILLLSQANPPAHIPYRDSKLTCLLQNTLGGNCLAAMIACASPASACMEETINTLDYSARAKAISNRVQVNEDPRTKLIRELRAEVALLRAQLAAAPAGELSLFAGVKQAQEAALQLLEPKEMETSPFCTANTEDGQASGSNATEGMAFTAPAAVVRTEAQDTTVEVVGLQLVQSVRMLHQLHSTHQQLQQAYARVSAQAEHASVSTDALMTENTQLRDQLSLYEGLVSWGEETHSESPTGARSAAGPGSPPSSTKVANGIYTASAAALMELAELRRENQLLHECLRQSGAARPASMLIASKIMQRNELSPSTQSPGRSRRNTGSPAPRDLLEARRTGSPGPGHSARRTSMQGLGETARAVTPSQLQAILRNAPLQIQKPGSAESVLANVAMLVPKAGTHHAGIAGQVHRISTTGQLLPRAVASAAGQAVSGAAVNHSSVHKVLHQMKATGQL